MHAAARIFIGKDKFLILELAKKHHRTVALTNICILDKQI